MSKDVTDSLPPELRLYTVEETRRILKLSDPATRRLIHDGEIAASRVGVLLRISQRAIICSWDEKLARNGVGEVTLRPAEPVQSIDSQFAAGRVWGQ